MAKRKSKPHVDEVWMFKKGRTVPEWFLTANRELVDITFHKDVRITKDINGVFHIWACDGEPGNMIQVERKPGTSTDMSSIPIKGQGNGQLQIHAGRWDE